MSDPYSGYPRDSLGVPQGVPGSGFTLPALLHWMWYGKRPGGGLNAFPGQLISAFDPRSKAGAANLLSMFAGGGKFDASPQMEGLGMHGQFETYSPAKAAAGGHMSSDTQPEVVGHLIRLAGNRMQGHESALVGAQRMHDLIFGGEVHAKGDIPPRPDAVRLGKAPKPEPNPRDILKAPQRKVDHTASFKEPPHNTEDVVQHIADKLGIHRDRVEAQMRAAEQHNAHVARQQAHEAAVARMLHSHGFSQHPAEHLHDALDERAQAAHEGQGRFRDVIHSANSMRQHAANPHEGAEFFRNNSRGVQESIYGRYEDQMGPSHDVLRGSKLSPSARRQDALRRIVAQHFHHRN